MKIMDTTTNMLRRVLRFSKRTLESIQKQISDFLDSMYQIINNLPKESLITLLICAVFLIAILSIIILKNNKKNKGLVLKDVLNSIPARFCYWEESGSDFFVHEDIPVILKSSLNGYSLIHFLLNYNQEIQSQFSKLQSGIMTHFSSMITGLAVEISVYKKDNYFFLTVQKNNRDPDRIIRSAINEMPGNMTWIEVDGAVVFRNELCERYQALVSVLSSNKDNEISSTKDMKDSRDNNIISIDNVLYKYNRYQTTSYTINMLNEINEFKTFHQDEKNKKLIYNFLLFLKEKFLILNRDGKVIFISEGLKGLINLDKEKIIYDVADLINVMKENLSLPEEVNFQAYIDNYKKKIAQCEDIESDYFSSLEGRVFSRTIFPKSNHVMIVFEDISQQIASEKEYLQNKNLQNIYLNDLDEGVIVFDNSGKLIYHNEAILNFIGEQYISNMNNFENSLSLKTDNADENFRVYISTSIKKDNLFTISRSNIENFHAYILKGYCTNNNQSMDYFYNLLQEIDNQWRYLDYVKSQEKNVRSLEQIALIFKSLHRVKVFTASNVDYYDNPKLLANENIDIVSFIKSFLNKMSDIYNIKSFNIKYNAENYVISTDQALLERALLYFFDFFSSFFLVTDKSISVQVENEVFVLSMQVKQKFDFKNPLGTRLVFVMQKLFKFMNFHVNLVDEEDKFSFLITYEQE